MFTGIIEGFGTLRQMRSVGDGKRLAIGTDLVLEGTRIGDSIAVNGACLTVVTLASRLFEVDMAPETVARTTFKSLKPGARVNIERALRLSDRLDGHLVSGHVDGTGRITALNKESNALIVTVAVAEHLAIEIVEKGSVAIDGISLTVNRCSDSDFDVSIIPHTASMTTIGFKTVGDEVNIETDMIGKYVRRFLEKGIASPEPARSRDITRGLLASKGFL